MPIDLAAVNWLYVIILAVFVFVATFIGNLLSFSHRGMAALLSALVFTGIFVMWTYYPHHLPLPITVSEPKPAARRYRAGHTGGADYPGKAAQSGDRHHACAGNARAGTLALRPTVQLMFSQSSFKFMKARESGGVA